MIVGLAAFQPHCLQEGEDAGGRHLSEIVDPQFLPYDIFQYTGEIISLLIMWGLLTLTPFQA
jgi:hypothetical protein